MKKIIAGLLLALCVVNGWGANWYVDNAASGSNNGTSWANAWQSFSAIVWGGAGVVAGDSLLISGGTTVKRYSGMLEVGVSGTTNSNIIITTGKTANHNGLAIITQSNSGTVTNNVKIQNKQNIIIDKMEFDSCLNSGVLITNCKNITIRNCKCFYCAYNDASEAGVYLGTDTNTIIKKTEITKCTADGLRLNAARTVLVDSCTIHDNETDGIKDGGYNITISNCRIYNHTSTENHGDGMQIMSFPDTFIVKNCIFYNNTQNVYFEPLPGVLGGGSIFFYNNVIYNPIPGSDGLGGWYNGVIFTPFDQSIRSVYVFNNVFCNMNGGAGGLSLSNSAPNGIDTAYINNNIFYNSIVTIYNTVIKSKLVFDYNNYYNANRSWYLPGFTNLTDYKSEHPENEENGFYAYPVFADTGAHDFKLQSTSPCRDTGLIITAKEEKTFNYDFFGNERSATVKWDLGPYNYYTYTNKRALITIVR